MSVFKRPLNSDEWANNFAQIKPLMNATMAYYESSRCLFCYDAPCVKACPTGIDIPLFIKQINSDNLTGAARTIYEANYFGFTCGKVCPTEVLCEGACVYNLQGVKPIEIGRLQSYASSRSIQESKALFQRAPENGHKIAVIGAGPAGLSCACELRRLGYHVDIYEAKKLPSGLALHGTAPYKITNKEVLDEMDYLKDQFGFNIFYNSSIRSRAQFDELETKYDVIFLGIGLGNTQSPGIPGEHLVNVVGATEFIENLKLNPHGVRIGQRVAVIGGGNTAMDAASEAARLGAEVYIFYRRSQEEMRAYDFEYQLAKSVGVKGIFKAQVKEIAGNGSVSVVRYVQSEPMEHGDNQIQERILEWPSDMVIMATGQRKQTDLFDLLGLDYDESGKLVVDEMGRTNHSKYYTGGDAANGGAEVVNACAEGKTAAQGIHLALNS